MLNRTIHTHYYSVMKRIHIVGCSPRSGTTLMAEMMKNCFEIDLTSEGEKRISASPPKRGNIFLTKTPKDTILVKDMLHVMKDLYVIYMLRDPRDVIVSKHPWDPARYWSSLKIWKLWTPFADALKDHPRFITVRYENLVSFPDEVQNKIQKHLPFLERKLLFSQFHINARPCPHARAALRGLRPVSHKSIGNWVNHRARVAGQILKYGSIGDDLIRYGYETDNGWEETLAQVTPDLSEGHPTKLSSEKYIRKKLRWNRLRALRVLANHSTPLLYLKERL